MPNTTHAEVLVVGGGLAGLTAAAQAARSGNQVVVLERSKALGGRAKTTSHAEYSFNLGPHALYRGGAAAEGLRALGVSWTSGLPGLRTYAGGLAVPRTTAPTPFAAAFAPWNTRILSHGAKMELARWFWQARRLEPHELPDQSVQNWLEESLTRASARKLVLALMRLWTYVAALDTLSARFALAQMQLALGSNVEYVDGGWQTLADVLARIARDDGAKVLAGARVERVEWIDGRHVATLADGTRYMADAVILAVGPKEAASLVTNEAKVYLTQCAFDCVPAYAACLDVALTSLPRKRSGFAIGVDAPLYLSNHASLARLAPRGGALVHLVKYLREPSRNPQGDQHELEAMLDRIQPGWRSRVVHRRFLPSLRVMEAVPRPDASRPMPQVPGEPGLFIAGDWVGDKGLLADASVASGLRAGSLAVEHVDSQLPVSAS